MKQALTIEFKVDEATVMEGWSEAERRKFADGDPEAIEAFECAALEMLQRGQVDADEVWISG